jgi:hypothetical protein
MLHKAHHRVIQLRLQPQTQLHQQAIAILKQQFVQVVYQIFWV